MDWTFLYDQKFIIGLSIPILFTILLTTIIAILRCFFSRREYVKKYFSIVWKKARKLKPSDFLGIRPYKEYYLKRDEDIEIEEALRNRQNVLIIGRPLSGKTRAAYEVTKKLKWRRDILVAIPQDIELKNFRIPKHFTFWRKRILFIDDFQIFVERNNFEHLIRQALEKNITIVATCRSGEELKKTEGKMAGVNLYLDMVFGENMIEMGTMDPEEGEKVADEVGIDWKTVAFNGTVGSIFMKLPEMKDRFQNKCSPQEKTVLRAMKDMYECGIFRADMIFPVEWIRTTVEKEGIRKAEYEWTALLESLAGWEFFSLEEGYVKPEEVYFEEIVTRPTEIGVLNLFRKILDIFCGVPEALVRLGNRAYKIGLYVLEKSEFMNIAILAYSNALKTYSLAESPEDYAMTQNNLGNAYCTLAMVEEKGDNCRRAIGAYQEALKVYTLERFPMDYAITQNNLGNAYSTLAEVGEKGDNCRRAIGAYQEALKIRTLERFPMDYAMTQNNLGYAYRTLAEVEEEEKGDNCRRAIGACQEALKVRTLERFQMQYAATQNNLGNAYSTLAEVEEKWDNCRRAIGAYQEALKFRTLEPFPMQYAMTQNNLGNAYRTLADVEEEEKGDNCRRAIGAYQEALKVYTLERFQMQYATTQNNLGNAYSTLAEVEDKSENCRQAVKSYQEALNIFKKENIYEAITSVEKNIAILKEFCQDLLE